MTKAERKPVNGAQVRAAAKHPHPAFARMLDVVSETGFPETLFRADVTVHDAKFMVSTPPGEPLFWAIWPSGSYLIRVLDRERRSARECANMIQAVFEPQRVRAYWWDGRELCQVTQEKALERLEEALHGR